MSPPLKVLVVDDERAAGNELAEVVTSFGYECRTAGDGLEAWSMHQKDHADVILSDWEMPRMDGLELCKRTRVADGTSGYTYFIFMTAFGDWEHFIQGMEAGADDYQTKPVDLDELQARLASAARVVSVYRRLTERNIALRRDSQTSFTLARVDALTGVANRLRLDGDLRALWSQAERYGRRYSIAMADIDWFKAYNDHFGHLAGDAALLSVAKAIQGQLRAGDSVYRYGGEEFVVVLPEQSLRRAAEAATRIRLAVQSLALHTVTGAGVMTLSLGVAELSPMDENAAAWLGRADSALYRAKARGRNRVEADPEGTRVALTPACLAHALHGKA